MWSNMLVKSAVSRARMLLRLGQLSPKSVKTLRGTQTYKLSPDAKYIEGMKPMLPTSRQYAEGLDRGTDAMIAKSNGQIMDMAQNATGFDAAVQAGRKRGHPPLMPTYSISRNTRGRISNYDPYFNSAESIGGDETRNLINKMPKAKRPLSIIGGYVDPAKFVRDIGNSRRLRDLGRLDRGLGRLDRKFFTSLASVTRRHELNESKQVMKPLSVINTIKDKKMKESLINKFKDSMFFSHGSPNVLTLEGKSLVGLDPRVIQFMKNMRSERVPAGATELQTLRHLVPSKQLNTGEYRA